MVENTCGKCKYFLRHYTFDSRKLFRVYCGHCTCRGAKRKYPDAPACDSFAPGPADTDVFATKEYLSKELLQYVLNMELLPEISEVSPPTKRKRRSK